MTNQESRMADRTVLIDGQEWVELGVVGVDSGQLLITDPGYIDSQWEEEEFVPDYPIYRLNQQGRARFPKAPETWTWRCFRDGSSNYGTPLQVLSGMSINTARDEGLLEAVPHDTPEPSASFSYNACCRLTIGQSYGQLNYRLGHEGVGVVFSSGYGDGTYPVYGRFDDDGRIVEVRIVMD